jgi:predicted dehydrogenase
MSKIRFLTLDPGHFHAALVQKEMYPGVAPEAHVYAPLGLDVADHLARVARFNQRAENPTRWAVELHTGEDFFARLLRERPGNVVVLAGRNRVKIDYILGALEAGLNVLADKPWIISAANLPKLQRALQEAERRHLVAYDIMTERFEITSILQRHLVNDPAVFGTLVAGSPSEPGVYMESVHHIFKTVAGVPLNRPPWYFDVTEQGEALADVGTHLVDLVQWILFPGQIIQPGWIAVDSARRWATEIDEATFRKITNAPCFPGYLAPWIRDGRLDYFANTQVAYRLGGIHVKLDVLWRLKAPAGGGDTHFAVYRGTQSRVEVRQRAEEKYRPELFVVPEEDGVAEALARRVAAWQAAFPGVGLKARGGEWLITIPDSYRVGHEAHFGQVTRQFLQYLDNPALLPAWENPNMLAKYSVCTKGVELAQ